MSLVGHADRISGISGFNLGDTVFRAAHDDIEIDKSICSRMLSRSITFTGHYLYLICRRSEDKVKNDGRFCKFVKVVSLSLSLSLSLSGEAQRKRKCSTV